MQAERFSLRKAGQKDKEEDEREQTENRESGTFPTGGKEENKECTEETAAHSGYQLQAVGKGHLHRQGECRKRPLYDG